VHKRTLAPVLASLMLGAGSLAGLAAAEEGRLVRRDENKNRSADKDDARDDKFLFADDPTLIADDLGADFLIGQDGADGVDGAAALEIPVGTAFAPALIASSDTCMGSHGFGAQVATVGVAIGRTWQDENCQRIKNARQLDAMGFRRAAVALLCVDDEVRQAMRTAGTPCPGEDLVSFEPEPLPQAEPAPPPQWPRYAVLFDFDSARLRPEADSLLQEMLATLQAEPDAYVDIVGHTDWVGTDAYNLGLSQRRAQSVVDWLVEHGISRERLNTVGMGEGEPIAENTTAEGRQQNRRVEIRRRG
jgi:outer membrane protein OmpA-like peptidoglycan-associated protein